MLTLLKLSENDKRVLIAFLLVFVLIIIFIAFIGSLIVRTMKKQGLKLDNEVSDAVITRVVKDKKHFKRYARKKNQKLLFTHARIALTIIMASCLILVIRNLIFGWNYNPFAIENGFSSLLFIWDFNDPECYSEFFNITLLSKWPPLINTPHFTIDAWAAYLFVPGIIVGGIWYLVAIQGFLARWLRINKLADSIYLKDLSEFNQNQQLINSLSGKMPPNVSSQNPQNPTPPTQ